MRLLERKDNDNFRLTEDLVNNIPAYAILSHTWGDDNQEVTFKDLVEGSGRRKVGFQKIRFCGEQAANHGLRYFWVDTCCIDKSSNTELSEALNSMYRWYRNAAKCYVYLADVSINDYNPIKQPSQPGEGAFRKSRWFTRGWTLQELIAPQSVEFFSLEGVLLGDKESLERQVHEITGIAVSVLQGEALSNSSVAERFSWAERRETRRAEDKAYSLLGIFSVYMPLLYGEGRENAFRRLREEVDKSLKLPMPIIEAQPKFTVPFVRDSRFVGRGDVIQEITNRLKIQRRIVLCGIGGIGKSQIAIEYCYIWKDCYPQCHVFWVHTSTLDRFEQAYRDISKLLAIPESEDLQNNTLTTVQDWLSKPENGPWLLVLDNADDIDLFFEVITTRDIRIGQRLTDREDIIMVTPLAPLDAMHLLSYKIPRGNTNTKDIQDLVTILGCIPLAITQAAAFIQENSIEVELYIKELQESESDFQDYLEDDLPDPRRYPDSKNSIIRTWKLSFAQIAKQRPRAIELLSLMVQLDRQAIPKVLLKQDAERGIEFNKAIGTLEAYSLIKTEKDGSHFEVHRLVQLSTQRWLNLQSKEAEWQEKALELIIQNFPNGDYGTWQECEDLLLHAKTVVKYKNTSEAMVLRRVKLVENIAGYEMSQGRFESAYSQYKEVAEIRKQNLTERHPLTLAAIGNLALVLRRQGKYAEAETMNRQTLELKEEVLGKMHPSTLATMSNLALVLDRQGKYAEAETMNRTTLELKEEVLGKMHPSTLTTMSNLAGVLDRRGKYTEAESISRQTLELSEEVLGTTHPETLTTMGNLAGVLSRQGKYAEAETMNRQTLELSEEVLGKTHPSTLTTISSLARVLHSQGKYAEAETMNRQTLEFLEEVLGKIHPSTLTTMGNLALVFDRQGKYAEAETMNRTTLELSEEVLGKTHPETLTTMSNLAGVLDRQGKFTEAETINRQTLELSEEILGKTHPETLTTMGNLAGVLSRQGKYTEAESINRKTLELLEEVLGKTHPETLTSVYCLAYLLQNKEEYEEAAILYQRACTGYESSLGPNHPRTIACMKHYSAMLEIISEIKVRNI